MQVFYRERVVMSLFFKTNGLVIMSTTLWSVSIYSNVTPILLSILNFSIKLETTCEFVESQAAKAIVGQTIY